MISATRFAALALMMALTACTLTGTKEGSDLYILKANIPPAAETLPLSLSIGAPEVAPGLDTARIAVMTDAHQLNYYTGKAWAAPLPETLQTFLIDAFSQSRRFRSVSSDTESAITDITLLTDVRECQVVDEQGTPTVRLRLNAKLVHSVGRDIIMSMPVEKVVPAEANNFDAIIAAFNRAMSDAATDIIAASAQQ